MKSFLSDILDLFLHDRKKQDDEEFNLEENEAPQVVAETADDVVRSGSGLSSVDVEDEPDLAYAAPAATGHLEKKTRKRSVSAAQTRKKQGEDDDDDERESRQITIYFPCKDYIERNAVILDESFTKNSLEQRCVWLAGVFAKKWVNVELKPLEEQSRQEQSEEDRRFVCELISRLNEKGPKLKIDYARMAAFIECDIRNQVTLIDCLVKDEKERQFLRRLAAERCISVEECARKLGYQTNIRNRCNSYILIDNVAQIWRNAGAAHLFGAVAEVLTGQCLDGREAYYTYYLYPKPCLLLWAAVADDGKIPALTGIEYISEGDIECIDNTDFLTQIPILCKLKASGAVKMGATKVPLSAAKTISSAMKFKSLPEVPYTLCDRAWILACLGAYIDVLRQECARNEDTPVGFSETEKMMGDLYDVIFMDNAFALKNLLSNSMTNMSVFIKNQLLLNLTGIISILRRMMKEMPVSEIDSSVGQWVDYDMVMRWLDFQQSRSEKYTLWVKFARYDELSKGSRLGFTDVRSRVQLPIINGLIMMLVSAGFLDMAYSESGGSDVVRYLRLSNAGLWATGRIDRLGTGGQKSNEGMVFDSRTLMVTVKNPEASNVVLLADLTEKVAPNRYRITEASLLRGCRRESELRQRIKLVKDYILEESDSASLALIESRLLQNVNKVRPDDMEDFVLVRIDPDDRDLQKFISMDEEIRRRSFRVEGWKLLVYRCYYSNFVERLRNAGYLMEE